MKRCILLLAAMSLCPAALPQSIPLGEIVGSDRSIHDSLYGVSARYPAGWIVRGVTRWGDKETTIFFGAPSPAGFPTLYYRMFNAPAIVASPESYLREEAQKKAEQRLAGGLADYANVEDSFSFKTIGGLPALGYFARYTGGGGIPQCEYFVRVLSPNGVAVFFLRAPVEELDGLRPAFDTMVESLRLP